MTDAPHKPPVRLLAWIAALFAGSLLAGALLAPHLFNLLLWIGRSFQSLEDLRDVEFERVASRAVMIVSLLAILPALTLSRLGSLRGLGFAPDRGWWRSVGWGWVAGALSMAALFALGWRLKAYRLDEGLAAGIAGRLVIYLAGALLVGVLEEALFRGALFGVLREAMGFWGGAIVSSAVFSVVHFAKPDPAVGTVYGHWYSGLQLLPQMFNRLDLGPRTFPLALTLFFMGLVLCAFYRRTGSLYFIIGLHAGWVWVMRAGTDLFERDRERLGLLFGPSNIVSKSWIALAVIVLFLAAALGWPRKKVPAGGAD